MLPALFQRGACVTGQSSLTVTFRENAQNIGEGNGQTAGKTRETRGHCSSNQKRSRLFLFWSIPKKISPKVKSLKKGFRV